MFNHSVLYIGTKYILNREIHVLADLFSERGSFDKVIFWPLKDWNENLISCKTMSLLPKIYNNPVAPFPVK